MQSAEEDWNPGNNEPDVGGAIDDILSEAARAAWRTAPDSPETVELERRQEYLWDGLGRMKHHAEDHWWDGPNRPDLSFFNASRHGLTNNGTGGAVNLTRGCSSNDCDGDSTVA